MEAKEIVLHYYDSLAQKTDEWKSLYADDAFFSDASGVLKAEGKEAVVESFANFLRGVESVKVKQLIIDRESICAVVTYDYINQKGEKMTQDDAEVWQINNGKLSKLTIYFDLTAYRTFMRG